MREERGERREQKRVEVLDKQNVRYKKKGSS